MRESPDPTGERARRRQIRRVKRYARLVGPFLAIPLLLAALSLSVDLIEYQPVPTNHDHLIDRPIRRLSTPDADRPAVPMPARVSAEDPESLISTMPQAAREADAAATDNDLELPPTPKRPTPPFALRAH
jgi:hypothetical protein